MGLPKVLLVLGVTLFVASVLGTLAALGVFFWYDVEFWYVFEVGPVLKIAAVLLSGFVISSGLLYGIRLKSFRTSCCLRPPVVVGDALDSLCLLKQF